MSNQEKTISSLMFRAAVTRNLSLIITLAVTFITVPMIINLLGDNWYGIWMVIGTFMGYFGIIDFGLSSATTRFLALHWKEKKLEDIGKTMSTSFIGFCVVSAVALSLNMVAMWIAPLFLEDQSQTEMLRIVVLILALDMTMTFPLTVFQAVLVVQLRNDLIAFVRIAQSVIKLGLVFWIVQNDGSIIHIALMSLGLNVIKNVFLIIAANNYLPSGTLRFHYFCKKSLKEYFHFGKFTFLGQIGDIILYRSDLMVIGGFLGSVLVVPYGIAIQLLRVSEDATINIISGTQPIFTRYFSEGRMDLIREKLLFLTRINISVSVIFTSSLLLVAEPLINIWVGPDYIAALGPLLILASILPLSIGQNAAIQTFYAMSRHKYYAYLNICEAAVNLSLSLILVQKLGIIGVALGTAIPFLIAKGIFLPYFICKFTDLKVSDYIINIVKPIIAIALMEASCFALITYLQFESFYIVFPIAAFWQGMIIVILLKYLAPKDDFNYINNMAPIIGKLLRRST